MGAQYDAFDHRQPPLDQQAACWRTVAAARCHHDGCIRRRAACKPCSLKQLMSSRASMPPKKPPMAGRHGGGGLRWRSLVHGKAPRQRGAARTTSSPSRSPRLLHGRPRRAADRRLQRVLGGHADGCQNRPRSNLKNLSTTRDAPSPRATGGDGAELPTQPAAVICSLAHRRCGSVQGDANDAGREGRLGRCGRRDVGVCAHSARQTVTGRTCRDRTSPKRAVLVARAAPLIEVLVWGPEWTFWRSRRHHGRAAW